MTGTISFDAACHISSPEGQRQRLNDAFASGDAAYIAIALGVIARARGMTEVAREAGVHGERFAGRSARTALLGVARAFG